MLRGGMEKKNQSTKQNKEQLKEQRSNLKTN